jgi:DNA polymerase III subunit delta'
MLARLARTGIAGPPPDAATGEAAMLVRLSPDAHAARTWAGLQQSAGARARHGRAVNLDPAMLLLDILLQMNETAAGLTARQGTT